MFCSPNKTSIETADTGPLTYLIYQLGSAHYIMWSGVTKVTKKHLLSPFSVLILYLDIRYFRKKNKHSE